MAHFTVVVSNNAYTDEVDVAAYRHAIHECDRPWAGLSESCGVNFSEQPPSRQWAALTFQGERIAEVWFKPEDEPLSVIFRIPRTSFQFPGIGHRLTTATLLKAVALAADEVESWQLEGAVRSDAELTNPLPQPADDVPHLMIVVRLKPSSQAVDEQSTHDTEIASATGTTLRPNGRRY